MSESKLTSDYNLWEDPWLSFSWSKTFTPWILKSSKLWKRRVKKPSSLLEWEDPVL